MKGYSIRLKFELMIKDLYFQIEEADDNDEKWKEACASLDEVGDSCSSGPEFFEKASKHFAKYGFERIAK